MESEVRASGGSLGDPPEESLRSFFDGASIGLAELDAGLCFVRVNAALANISGVPASAHIGNSFTNIVPGLATQIEPILRRVLMDGATIETEIAGETAVRPGVIKTWRCGYFPIRNSDHVVTGVGAVIEDITSHKDAEAARRENEARLTTMFDILSVGVGMFDERGSLILANRAMREFLPTGVIPSRDHEMRRSLWRTSDSGRQPIPSSDFPCERALHGERVVPGVEVIFTDDAGQERCLNVTSTPLLDAQGRLYGGFSSVTDITNEKQAEAKLARLNRELEARVFERTAELQREMKLREDTQAQLAQSQRLDALGKLTGGIAHDFNNLLMVITGNLELAEIQATNEELRSLVRLAIEAAESGAAINRRLLSFARRRNLAPQSININDRIVALQPVLRSSLGERITLVSHVDSDLWPTLADPGEIDSAILNISINARDAMPEGGSLTIATRNVMLEAKTRAVVAPGNFVSITLSDTGHGMSPDVLQRAVEPFFTTKERKGTGLGLASCYGFVHQCGGFLDISSEVGRGTEVTLFFPRAHQLCVKAHHTEAACRALLPHLAPDGYVLSLQNGLCETIIAPIIGAERTIGCFVNFSADWHGPGQIMYGGRGALVLGELDGATTPRLTALHALLRDTFEPNAIITPNIWGYLWGKLGYGAMLFAQALGEKGIADCLARPELLPLWRALGSEAIAVARAEGVTPLGFNGFDPAAFSPGATRGAGRGLRRRDGRIQPPQRQDAFGRLARPLGAPAAARKWTCRSPPSRPSARSTASPCPAVRALVAMTHECEAGTRPMSDANLTELLP